MNKIIVIGCPGSGKSTFSKELHKKTGIPLYHLDMMFWNSDKTNVGREELINKVSAVMQEESWIIDGNYGSTLEMRFKGCDTVFFLDIPSDICVSGVRSRIGIPRDDMPWTETEEDAEFIEFIMSFEQSIKPKILKLIKSYPEKKAIIFRSRDEIKSFLENI